MPGGVKTEVRTYQMYINGEWVASKSNKTFPVYDIADVATCFEYYGGLATKILGYVNPVPDNAVSLTLKEPIGVAGQIIPWNYPLLMAAWKLAPAVAAGCTCVLKPA